MDVTGVNLTTHSMNLVTSDLVRLRETVGQVFGSVFFGTLLKAMRDSDLKVSYGHGGYGEEVFAAQLHGLLAERAGTSVQNETAEAVFDRLARQQQRISEQE